MAAVSDLLEQLCNVEQPLGVALRAGEALLVAANPARRVGRLGVLVGTEPDEDEPDSAGSQAFMALAESVMLQLAISAHQAVVANKGKIPLIQVK